MTADTGIFTKVYGSHDLSIVEGRGEGSTINLFRKEGDVVDCGNLLGYVSMKASKGPS